MIIIKKNEWTDRQHEANGASDIVLFNPGGPWGEHYVVLFSGDKEKAQYNFLQKCDPDRTNELLTAWISGTPIDIVSELVNPNEPEEQVTYSLSQRLRILFTGVLDDKK